jgi:hypothetical protein
MGEAMDPNLFPAYLPEPLDQGRRQDELSKLIASYRVLMNEHVGRMLYLDRQYRRHADAAAELVGTFTDGFLESCATIPDKPAEWDGGKAYASGNVYATVREMYRSARDLRAVAKKIVTIRRHFYRDLKVLDERHILGLSAFKRGGLLLEERRQWSPAERDAIWRKTEKSCHYCGRALLSSRGEDMHVDHLVPVITGGSDEIENLTAACPPCNLKKGAKSEEAMLAALLVGRRSKILDGIIPVDMEEVPVPLEVSPEAGGLYNAPGEEEIEKDIEF